MNKTYSSYSTNETDPPYSINKPGSSYSMNKTHRSSIYNMYMVRDDGELSKLWLTWGAVPRVLLGCPIVNGSPGAYAVRGWRCSRVRKTQRNFPWKTAMEDRATVLTAHDTWNKNAVSRMTKGERTVEGSKHPILQNKNLTIQTHLIRWTISIYLIRFIKNLHLFRCTRQAHLIQRTGNIHLILWTN